MLSYPAQLNRIYLDLGPPTLGLLHTEGVDYTARGFAAPAPAVSWVQRQMSRHFRRRLAALPGAQAYSARRPHDLPAELRTPRWQALCDAVAGWEGLDHWQQVWTARLLLALCMHDEVLRLVPPQRAGDLARSEPAAQLASARVTAQVAVAIDTGGRADAGVDRSEALLLAEAAPEGSPARLSALVHLILQSSQVTPDHALARRWAEAGQGCVDAFVAGEPAPVDRELAISRFHRAVALVPVIERDHAAMSRHMDLAEEHARAALEVAEDDVLARENLYSVLESRTKEALLREDLPGAERYARALVELTPLDAKAYIELGEVLVRKGEVEEALAAYLRAAQEGPPGEAIAWFMAGQCAQKVGDTTLAQHCFLTALQCDPLGVSSYRHLAALNVEGASAVGRLLSEWAVHMQDRLRPAVDVASGAGLQARST